MVIDKGVNLTQGTNAKQLELYNTPGEYFDSGIIPAIIIINIITKWLGFVFYNLEKLMLLLRVCCLTDGLDFYYATRQEARKFVDFLLSVVPCRSVAMRCFGGL